MSIISTNRHGGVRVHKDFAHKNLSKAAIKRGIPLKNYYYFEEDCDWAIVAWELKEHQDKFVSSDNPEEIIKNNLLKWNKKYLEEVS